MKRARAQQMAEDDPPTLESKTPLRWSNIVKTIGTHALQTALEKNHKKQGYKVRYMIWADPTLELDADIEITDDSANLFLHPTQFNLLCSTHSTVLQRRTKEVYLNFLVYQGYCECSSLTLTRFSLMGNRAAELEFCFDNFDFDSACYFGTDPCAIAKAVFQEGKQTWKEDGYCNRIGDHCTTHEAPFPKVSKK